MQTLNFIFKISPFKRKPQEKTDSKARVVCIRRTKTSQSPRQVSNLLQLPTEILDSILLEISDPKAYLNLYRVNHQLRNLASNECTRRAYVNNWFSKHCNNEPDQAPELIAYIARYLRRHALQDRCLEKYTCFPLSHQPPIWQKYAIWATIKRPRRIMTFWRSREYNWYPWMKRYTEMLAERTIASDDNWTVDNVKLDLEDAVFAKILYDQHKRMENSRRGKGIRPEKARTPLGLYLLDWEERRRILICLCGRSEDHLDG
ncbi:hypothetical protein BJ508DRAFT_166345 [Ascobolus immersus RN42]|uniref:F-box domain-containing protein n=1 Tax=Ascobolus immersus RN42 TaxID=1160509 RepID=A0A3N4ILU5_ASCIM|nr:hypothetical protein BJ508DRAFT_166345 [Ascobolus immersus RN42]